MPRLSGGGPFEGLAAVLAAVFAGMTLWGLTSTHWPVALGCGAMLLALGTAWWWSHRLGLRRRR